MELKKRYTVYELKYVLLLEGQYAPSLYELLKKIEWFLDQRTKDLIRGELSKIAKPILEEVERRKEIEEVFNEVISTYQFLPKEGKVEILKIYGGKEKFQAFLKNLKENLDAKGLKNVLTKLKEIAESHRSELDDIL